MVLRTAELEARAERDRLERLTCAPESKVRTREYDEPRAVSEELVQVVPEEGADDLARVEREVPEIRIRGR
jgi:hypothetical protein